MPNNTIKIVSSIDVESHILPRITLSSLLRSQAIAFHSLLRSSSSTSTPSQCPPRLSLTAPDYTQLFMPARTSSSPGSVIKCVSIPKPSSSSARSGIPGVNLLFDDDTGRLSHVVNSSCLTALRTAAGSLLSSVLALGKVKDQVKSILVFGDGAQAVFHVWLHLRYFPSIKQVTVVVGQHRDLTSEEVRAKEDKLQAQLSALLHNRSLSKSSLTFLRADSEKSQVETALGTASIICTCTPSTVALFDHSSIVSPIRTHICAVGSYKPTMCELPPEVVRSASSQGSLMVDSKEACSHEAGCLIQAGLQVEEGSVELGTLLPDPTVGEEEGYLERLEKQQWKEAEVSVFKSVGVGLQDVEATKLVVRLSKGFGVDVPF
ncbi:uncharacterized protein UDID_07046 [Ustilago sp. UG-2017a]|nr:uncharacterized protein UDID_07046 [Ustilago sp. UG-2017a]